MSTTTIVILVLIALAILFLIARLAVRWAIRATIVGVIIIALLGGGGIWWWTNRLAPKPVPKPRTSSPRRTSN